VRIKPNRFRPTYRYAHNHGELICVLSSLIGNVRLVIEFTEKNKPIYRKVEQWEIYDRIAGSNAYPDADKEFLPYERYDWTLLTEIELFKNAVKGCQKVLDIGCGTGHPALYIAEDVDSIVGIDRSKRMIEIARSRLKRRRANNIVFEVGNAENLWFADGAFDAVVLCGSLATFSDKKRALREVKRVLKKDGKVACIEANWLFRSAKGRHFQREGSFTLTQENQIKYRYVERSFHPHKETDYRCIVDPDNDLGKRLVSNQGFLKSRFLKSHMSVKEVEPYCAEIEYDEEEKFDSETLAHLFAENCFKGMQVSGYGVTYDFLKSASLIDKLSPYMRQLCKAEAMLSSFLDPSKTEMLFLTCRA
jgi:SAM-dependent methyltransferase